MKVEYTSIYVGENNRSERNGLQNERNGKKRGSIFVGNMNQALDPIAQKRQEARKKAMKVVGDVFADEKKIDDDMEARKDHISQLRDGIKTAQEAISQIDKEKDQLREARGIAIDSQEQKDLELLQKEKDSFKLNSGVTLTDEDRKRLEEIEAAGLTEYQKQALEMESYKSPYQKEIDEANKQILEESAIIKGVRLERLKSPPMVAASKEADAIIDAAEDEIMGMLIKEGKDYIDELHKEEEEAAKKKAEEEEEKEEQLEEIREDKEEQQERIEKKKTEVLTEQVLDLDEVQTNVKAEVENIVDKMNLVIEDIKGSVVDEKL